MNKKGFTLMELLLVVAVLAIVAAAAAPTFFGGAQEAMNEAKKATFMSAYQNTISGANIMLSLASAQGKVPTANVPKLSADATLTGKNLDDYAPAAARTFSLEASTTIVLDAMYDASEKKIYVINGNGAKLDPNVATMTFDQLVTDVKKAGSSSSSGSGE